MIVDRRVVSCHRLLDYHGAELWLLVTIEYLADTPFLTSFNLIYIVTAGRKKVAYLVVVWSIHPILDHDRSFTVIVYDYGSNKQAGIGFSMHECMYMSVHVCTMYKIEQEPFSLYNY